MCPPLLSVTELPNPSRASQSRIWIFIWMIPSRCVTALVGLIWWSIEIIESMWMKIKYAIKFSLTWHHCRINSDQGIEGHNTFANVIAFIFTLLFRTQQLNSTIVVKLWYSSSYLRMHDDVIKWEHFPRDWPFVRGIHRSPLNSPHKGQWRGVLMFSLICIWKKRLSEQSWGWWFETLSRSLWRHCDGLNLCLGKPPSNERSRFMCNLFSAIDRNWPQRNHSNYRQHCWKYGHEFNYVGGSLTPIMVSLTFMMGSMSIITEHMSDFAEGIQPTKTLPGIYGLVLVSNVLSSLLYFVGLRVIIGNNDKCSVIFPIQLYAWRKINGPLSIINLEAKWRRGLL